MTTDSTTPEPAPKWTCPLPPSEMLMSLNGFEEIGIAMHFGEKIGTLKDDAVTAGRALVFVHKRRSGAHATDREAYEAAMNLTMHEVIDYFAPEPKSQDAEGNEPGA